MGASSSGSRSAALPTDYSALDSMHTILDTFRRVLPSRYSRRVRHLVLSGCWSRLGSLFPVHVPSSWAAATSLAVPLPQC